MYYICLFVCLIFWTELCHLHSYAGTLAYSLIFGEDPFEMHFGLDEVDCRASMMGIVPLEDKAWALVREITPSVSAL